MSDGKKIVWILGAGFSRSLGGPLLGTLLSRSSEGILKASFPPAMFPRLHDSVADAARWLFHWGMRFPEGSYLASSVLAGEQLWQDAEDYLDQLDAAGQAKAGVSSWDHLVDIFYRGSPTHFRAKPECKDLKAIAVAARRVLAAECAAFLQRADPTTERWAPYRRWVTLLEAQDTVITFNYDRAIETITAMTQATTSNPAISVLLPGANRSDLKAAALIKLHGSVDWKRLPANIPSATIESDYFALSGAPNEIIIASPGPTKASTTQNLASLWDEAEKALKEADAIAFVGYRFPPTDANSRERLLRAIGQNAQEHLAVHVVLGPDLGSRDVVRLQKMLDVVTFGDAWRLRPNVSGSNPRRGVLRVQPLWAEDFFTIFKRNFVTNPQMFE